MKISILENYNQSQYEEKASGFNLSLLNEEVKREDSQENFDLNVINKII